MDVSGRNDISISGAEERGGTLIRWKLLLLQETSRWEEGEEGRTRQWRIIN